MNEKPSALEMRLGGSFLKTVDEWRRKQKDLPSRAEAIRRLVERGLANRPSARQLSEGAKHALLNFISANRNYCAPGSLTNTPEKIMRPR